MIALPAHGFVMLSMPKCASTSLEEMLSPKSEIIVKNNPLLKHLNCRQFHTKIVPLLRMAGYSRRDYEVVSLFREPITWLGSWWRYRSRPGLRVEGLESDRYAGALSFEEFTARYLDGDPSASVIRGRPARFVAGGPRPKVRMNRLFALEQPEVWRGWIQDRLGAELDVSTVNRSRVRDEPTLSAHMRARLEEHFAPEYEIYEHLRATGQWCPPRGYAPAEPAD